VIEKLLKSTGLARYFKNTLWLMLGRMGGLVLALLISIWTARYLGPAQFGQLSFAYNFAILFAALAPLGIGRILDRDLVRNEFDKKELVSTGFFLVLIGASIAYGVMALVVTSRGYDSTSVALVLIMGLIAFLHVNIVLIAYFLSQVKAKPLSIANLSALVVSNIIKVLFILNDAPLIYFAWGFVFDWLLTLPIFLAVLRNTDGFPSYRYFSLSTAQYLLKQSWPYILTGMMISLYMKIDTVMIKEMLGDYAAGQYSAASRLSEGVYFIPLTVVASLYPAIVNAKKNDQHMYINRLSNLYSMLFFAAITISIGVSIATPFIINFLYGPAYAEAIPVLIVHIWACIFVFIGISSGRWLLTENLQSISMVNTFIGAVTNILLNLVFIPKFGIIGAAWASVISYAVSGYLCFALWPKTRTNFVLMTKSFMRLPNLSNLR